MYFVETKGGYESCHRNQESDNHNKPVNVIHVRGVAVLSRTRIYTSIDGPSIHEDGRLALVSIPLTASSYRDISISCHVESDDLGTVVRKDSKSLGHSSFSWDTRVLIGCSVTTVIAPPITP
jgi:hypothetical protein